MGGLEQLHPLFQPLCGWAGEDRRGRRNPEGDRHGCGALSLEDRERGRRGEREREGERERSKRRSLGWGSAAPPAPQQPVASPPGPSPAGSGAGGNRGVRGSRWGRGRVLPNRLQQHVPGRGGSARSREGVWLPWDGGLLDPQGGSLAPHR